MSELPEDLQQMQDKINDYHKEEALKKQIGKYYSRHEGTGYPVALRRIYTDKQEHIRVDDYYAPHDGSEFNFKTWVITEELREHNQYEFREVEEVNVWYNCLKILSGISQIKNIFIPNSLETLQTKYSGDKK